MANDRRSWRSGAMAATLLVVWLVSSAGAQRYQSDPVDENAGRLKLTAKEWVKNPARWSQERDQFVQFFDKYYFPAMTRTGPNDLGQLGRMRDELFGTFLWASTNEEFQSQLTQMALTKLWEIAPSSKYHPAVRYNAVLIIGMLDKTYAAPGRPPVPLKEGFDKLFVVLDLAVKGKQVPPFLVVGALVGLQRHAQLHESLEPRTRAATMEQMTAIAQKLAIQEELFPDVDPKVDEWIRLQAATVLANLGNPGPKGEVSATLAKLVAGETKPKMSIDARGQVAALLKKFKFEGASADGKVLADALLQLAFDVGTDEAKEATAFEEIQLQGGGYGGAGGGARSTRMKLDLETQMWKYSPNILLSRLADLKAGLDAFRPQAPADQQPVFDAVLAAIRPAATAASSADAIDLDVAQKVREMGDQIRSAVKPGSAPTTSDASAELF